MTLEDRIKFCKVCRNRRQTLEQGVICGLSGEKPEFESQCDHYSVDEVAEKRVKLQEEAVEKSKGAISGFLAFFVYWVIPLSTVVTLVNNIICWDQNTAYGPVMTAWVIVFLAFYVYFQSYTVYGFVTRKPDAVFLSKYQLIVVALFNVLSLIGGTVEDEMVVRLIISLIWAVIWFVYLTVSEDVKDLIPPETRKLTRFNKVMFILSLVIPTVLFIGVVAGGFLGGGKRQLEEICASTREELPQQLSEDVIWEDLVVEDESLVYKYSYTEEASSSFEGANEAAVEFLSLYQRELGKSAFSELTVDDDPCFPLCSKLGYDIKVEYTTSAGAPVASYSLNKDEYMKLFSEDYSYSLTAEVYQEILDKYNKLLPIVFVEDCDLTQCHFDEASNALHYTLELKDVDSGALTGITARYLKDYMKEMLPYMADGPFVLAVTNKKDLVFDFESGPNPWWHRSVRITPEEYSALVEGEDKTS